MAMDIAEHGGIASAVRTRRETLFQRVTSAVLLCMMTSRLMGWELALFWLAGYMLAVGLELIVWAPVNHRRTDRLPAWRTGLGLITVAISSASYGVISVPLWQQGGAIGGVCAALVLSAALINIVVTTPGSASMLTFAVAPQFAYMAASVGFAHGYALTPAFEKAVALGVLVFCAYVIVLWRTMEKGNLARAQAQFENEERRVAVEQAVAAKSQFVACVSHELRTPISAMLAGAAELEAMMTDPAARDRIALIGDAGRMMKTLLDDILDHAKLEAGRMKVEVTTFAVRDLITQTLRFWRAEAQKKGLALRIVGAGALPADLRGDPTRLRQVLNNLLSNSIKFTTHGAITLSVRAWPCGDDACAMTLSVIDTGEGMDADQIARLFQPFEQADEAVGRLHGGTGLGLSISRQLARAMGGELVVRSVKGEGSAFTLALTLPLAEPGLAEVDPVDTLGALADALNADRCEADAPAPTPEPAPEPTPPPPAPEGDPTERPLRVLVADDHEINRRAVELVLAPAGATITTVINGRLALEAALQQPFDLIVMDVRMPEMNGREATRQLRAQPGPNRDTPVIAVTADTDSHDMEACRDAGMNWFVGKPIDPAKLIDTAVQALEHAEQVRDEARAGRQVA